MQLRDIIVKALQGFRFGRRAPPAQQDDAAPIIIKRTQRAHYHTLNVGHTPRQGNRH